MAFFQRLAFCSSIALVACGFGGDSGGKPCVPWDESVRPLLMGDTIQLRAGYMHESDCVISPTREAKWRSSDTTVADVSQSGVLTSVSPGTFRVFANVEGIEAYTDGFVLPRNWKPLISPESASVVVGDSVRFVVRAVTEDGRTLPMVPYSLYTPEFEKQYEEFSSGRGPSAHEYKPLFDKWSAQLQVLPFTFVAERSGRTHLTGMIGRKKVVARVDISERTLPDTR